MLDFLGSFLKCTGCAQRFNFDAPDCYGYYSNHSSNLTTFSNMNIHVDDVTGLRRHGEVDSVSVTFAMLVFAL